MGNEVKLIERHVRSLSSRASSRAAFVGDYRNTEANWGCFSRCWKASRWHDSRPRKKKKNTKHVYTNVQGPRVNDPVFSDLSRSL